jgi:hypothetical protein
MLKTSKFILPYEPGYTGHWEAENAARKPASGCGSVSATLLHHRSCRKRRKETRR